MLENREKLAREAVRKVKKNRAELFTKEASQRLWRAHTEKADIEKVVALAREGDKDAIEIQKICTRCCPHSHERPARSSRIRLGMVHRRTTESGKPERARRTPG